MNKKLLNISTSLALLAVAAAAGTALFWTSQNVQQREAELRQLRQALMHEQKTIRVLEAEWSYLNRPARLEALAAQYLDLARPAPAHILTSPAALPDFLGPPGSESLSLPPQEVSLSARPATSAPVPGIKPSPQEKRSHSRSFQNLLQDLDENSRRGESGGL